MKRLNILTAQLREMGEIDSVDVYEPYFLDLFAATDDMEDTRTSPVRLNM